jgi:hypothetical protein
MDELYANHVTKSLTGLAIGRENPNNGHLMDRDDDRLF